MQANLSIEVINVTNKEVQEINFFEAEEWCADSEKELFQKMQGLLSSIRHVSNSFEIKITVEVHDSQAALFHINKKNAAYSDSTNQKLSIREIEVLGLIMQGLTNNEIAEKLFISYETVKSHRKHILEKTGAKNTASLINYYHQTFFEK
jgi:DNA-binding CsgD family transcriptional regulator